MLKYTIKNSLNFFTFALTLLTNFTGIGQTVTISGTDWNVNPPVLTEAGSNYSGTYESAVNQLLLSISVPGLLGLLRTETVLVHYEANSLWNSNLMLNIRRTNSGGGGGICIGCGISGGTAYQPITTNASNFFNINIPVGLGTKTFTNIPLQLSVSGVSVTVPVANYNARIVFTITN